MTISNNHDHIHNINIGRNILEATIKINPDTLPRIVNLKGQTARALVALVKAGRQGTTALEISSWALRLSAYVHTLRTKHGIDIITRPEEHEGGTHARYVLLTPVEVLSIQQNV